MLFSSPFLCMQKVLSGTISNVQCLSSSGTVGKSSSSSGLSEYTGMLSGSWSSSELSEYTGVLSGSWSWHQCEGTDMVHWLIYSPMLIPRQLRFSLYSGAVITEGLM